MTLIEFLVVLSVVGLAVGVATPSFLRMHRHAAARSAAMEIRSIFAACRSRAVARGIDAGVKFSQSDGQWRYTVYDDGNANGIRNKDITSGIDRPLAAPRRVVDHASLAFIGLPPAPMIDPDGDPLPPTKSPVQFNSSTIASFSPLGESTPGSIYLTDRYAEAYVVRLYGATARIRLLRYDWTKKKWEARW